MKEPEFIELLNLYLDHEISAADAARLESQVQSNQARRKVYQQYCRMQKACKVLAVDFQTEEAAVAAERKVVAFDPAAAGVVADQRRRVNAFYTAGALVAAAACVAIIFVNRGQPGAAEIPAQAAVVAQVTPATTVAAKPVAMPKESGAPRGGIVSAAGVPAPGERSPASLVADPLLLNNSQAEAVMAAALQDANNQLAWIQKLQIAPLQQITPIQDLRFDARPATLRPEAHMLGGNRAAADANVEMTAFRITK